MTTPLLLHAEQFYRGQFRMVSIPSWRSVKSSIVILIVGDSTVCLVTPAFPRPTCWDARRSPWSELIVAVLRLITTLVDTLAGPDSADKRAVRMESGPWVKSQRRDSYIGFAV